MKVVEIKINNENYITNVNETVVIVTKKLFGEPGKVNLNLLNNNLEKNFIIDENELNSILQQLYDIEYFELNYNKYTLYAVKNIFNFTIDKNILSISNNFYSKKIPLRYLKLVGLVDIKEELKQLFYSNNINIEGTQLNFRTKPFIDRVENGKIGIGINVITIYGYNFSPDTIVILNGQMNLINYTYISPIQMEIEVEANNYGMFNITLNNNGTEYTYINGITVSDYITKLVKWKSLNNTVEDEDGSLRKTNGSGWNSGAISKMKISKDDIGYIEITLSDQSKRYMIGLSHDNNSNSSYRDINYAFYFRFNRCGIYFNGSNKLPSLPYYNIDDICKIELTMDNIIWYINNNEIYRTTRPYKDLYVDTSLYDRNTVIQPVTIHGILI